MKIQLLKSTGTGPTKLAAFDNALYKINLHDYNIIELSSVIPANSEIEMATKYQTVKKNIGNRLYCVACSKMISKPGELACAGLGWSMRPSDKSGIFIEISGNNFDQTKNDIVNSLRSMTKYREGEYEHNFLIEKIICKDLPVCALVIAVYKQENW